MIKNKSIVSNNGLDVGPFNLVNTKDSPNIYYDKRLIRICQVPQMPYLEFNTDINMYQPMKDLMNEVRINELNLNKKSSKPDMQIDKTSISSESPSFPVEPQLSLGSRATHILLQNDTEHQA